MSDIGHNSAGDELLGFINRVERLEEEKKGLNDDIKDIIAEVKGRGYDPKIIRKVLAIRKMKPGEYEEQQMVIETYMSSLGMI